MKNPTERALERITSETDLKLLMQIASNARGKSDEVEKAALRRIAEVSAGHDPGTPENECWKMIHAVETLRRLSGRKSPRMNRMRLKVKRDGEVAALAYCASTRTPGFEEIIGYGTPELTAEAIVLRYPQFFEQAVLDAARVRLQGEGIDISGLNGGSH